MEQPSHLATLIKSFLIYGIGIFIAWMSIIPSMTSSIDEIISATAESSNGAQSSTYTERVIATDYINNMQSAIFKRSESRWKSACIDHQNINSPADPKTRRTDLKDQASTHLEKHPTEDQPFIDNPCDTNRPENNRYNFYQFATQDEIRGYEAAISDRDKIRAKLEKLREVATVDLVGTRISLPKITIPIFASLACAYLCIILHKIMKTSLKANAAVGETDSDNIFLSSDNTEGQQAETPSAVFSIAVVALFLFIVSNAYYGLLMSNKSWSIRTLLGFDGDFGKYRRIGYEIFIISSSTIMAFCCLNFVIWQASKEISTKSLNIKKRRFIAIITVMPAIFTVQKFAADRWNIKTAARFLARVRSKNGAAIPLENQYEHGFYGTRCNNQLSYAAAACSEAIFYISKTKKIYYEPANLDMSVNLYHKVNLTTSTEFIQRLRAGRSGRLLSIIVENAALDAFEDKKTDLCLKILDDAIDYNFSQTVNISPKISVRLLDLRALITLRHMTNSDIRKFSDHIAKLEEQRQRNHRKALSDSKVIEARIQKWRGSAWREESNKQKWQDKRSKLNKASWTCLEPARPQHDAEKRTVRKVDL